MLFVIKSYLKAIKHGHVDVHEDYVIVNLLRQVSLLQKVDCLFAMVCLLYVNQWVYLLKQFLHNEDAIGWIIYDKHLTVIILSADSACCVEVGVDLLQLFVKCVEVMGRVERTIVQKVGLNVSGQGVEWLISVINLVSACFMAY